MTEKPAENGPVEPADDAADPLRRAAEHDTAGSPDGDNRPAPDDDLYSLRRTPELDALRGPADTLHLPADEAEPEPAAERTQPVWSESTGPTERPEAAWTAEPAPAEPLPA